jgi:hypothetical protein
MSESTALRLADALEAWTLGKPTHHREAAAELRRLHGLDFALRDCELALQKMATKYMDAVDQRDALLEALKFYGSSCDATESTPCGYEGNLCCKRARVAIAWAEGEKT